MLKFLKSALGDGEGNFSSTRIAFWIVIINMLVVMDIKIFHSTDITSNLKDVIIFVIGIAFGGQGLKSLAENVNIGNITKKEETPTVMRGSTE